MEFDRGKLVSEKCKGKGLEIVKTVTGAELCLDNDIPEWLLMEVLIRLPVKLVFKCKLVCKRWLSVISDTCFARMYVLRASLSTQLPTWTFIYSHMYVEGKPKLELFDDIYSQNLKCPSLYSFRCPFIIYPHNESYKIFGVSNDLVLYGASNNMGPHCIYNICNPTTRQWISLPPCRHCPEFESIGFVTHTENGALSSHRVVRLELPLRRSNIIRFLVFISETSEWKEFVVNTKQGIFDITERGSTTTLNGILHWITIMHGIMAYDPYLKPDSVRFIALPSDVDPTCNIGDRGMRTLCDAYQGCLRYFESRGNRPRGFSSIGIWILNDYNSGDWCLQHRIDSVDIIYDDVLSSIDLFLDPIYFHPFDPEIVYLGHDNTIVSYNIKTRKLESRGGVFRARVWCPYSTSTFLFVVPPWPTSICPLPLLESL